MHVPLDFRRISCTELLQPEEPDQSKKSFAGFVGDDRMDLRNELQQAGGREEPLAHAMKQQRSVIKDICKRLRAVSKALEKRPSQPQHNQWPDLIDPAHSQTVPSETTATQKNQLPTSALSLTNGRVKRSRRGKAYFTALSTLGQYLLMDYIQRKSKTIH